MIVPRVENGLELVLTHDALERFPLHRPATRDELDHHLALDHLEAGLARDRLQGNHQRGSRGVGVGRLPVVDRDRAPLVLDPRVRYSGGCGLDERHDRGQQLGGLFLEPVQPDVHDVRQIEERRHLFGPASGDDRYRPVTLGEPGDRVACSFDGTREVGPDDDLGQRSVEVERDARDSCPFEERRQVRRT